MEVHEGVWKVMTIDSHLVDGAEQKVEPGSAQAQSGQWWEGLSGRQSWVRCERAVGGDCSQGEAAEEAGDGGCEAVVVWEEAVGGWPGRGGEGFHLARRQGVHGVDHSPGTPDCRSSHPLPWNRLLHLSHPSEVGGGDSGGVCHGGP